MTTKAVRDLRQGDRIDLQGDSHADPKGDNEVYRLMYLTVENVMPCMTKGSLRVCIAEAVADPVLPADHMVRVHIGKPEEARPSVGHPRQPERIVVLASASPDRVLSTDRYLLGLLGNSDLGGPHGTQLPDTATLIEHISRTLAGERIWSGTVGHERVVIIDTARVGAVLHQPRSA